MAFRLRRSLSLSYPLLHHSIHRSKPISSRLLSSPIFTTSTAAAVIPSSNQLTRPFTSTSTLYLKTFNPDTDEIGPDTILFEGCDYNHWLITIEFPKDSEITREQMIETYVNTAAQVFGSVEEAKKKIYALSTTTYQGFQVECSEETSEKFKSLPGVVFVLPDSYIDPANKEYGGDKYVNGEIFPRPPPVHYGRRDNRDRRRRDNYGPPNQQNYGPPNQQNYGPPNQQNYGPPNQQNYGPPNQQNYGPPNQQNYGPPNQQNYRPPNQQNIAPGQQQNYGPPQPQKNFSPPRQDFDAPPTRQNFDPSPPRQDVSPSPRQGFISPPRQEFAPTTRQNYTPPPRQDYAPPPQQNYGQSPPQQNYGQPSQQNYGPPPQQNYGNHPNSPYQQNYGNHPNSPPQQNYVPQGSGDKRSFTSPSYAYQGNLDSGNPYIEEQMPWPAPQSGFSPDSANGSPRSAVSEQASGLRRDFPSIRE